MKARHPRTFGFILLLLTMSTFSIMASMTNLPLVHGAAWSPEAPITTPAGDDRSPAFIKLSGGTQFLVWSTNKDGTPDLYFMRKSGGSWSSPAKVEQGGLGATYWDQYPALVELANGKVMIVWSQCPPPNASTCNIVYNTYRLASPNWDPEGFTILTTDSSFNNAPTAMRNSDGYIYVFWQSNRNGDYDIYYSRSPNPDAFLPSWDPDTRMPHSTAGVEDLSPSAVPADGGGLWLAWHSYQDLRPCCPTRDAEIYLAKYQASWSAPVQLTATDARDDPVRESHDTDPALAKTADKGLWVVWETDRESSQSNADLNLYLRRSYDPLNLNSWSPEQGLTTDPDIDATPTAFEVSSGTIGVVWSSNRASVVSPYDLFYATLTFHNLQVLSVQPNPIAVQPGGTITLNVTIANRGAFPESVSLNIYANATLLTPSPITGTLVVGETSSFLHPWTTTGFAVGVYDILATVGAVLSEENPSDNSLVGGPAIVATRDVSVTSIIVPNCPNLSTCYIYQSQTINVNVNVANQGPVPETFTLTLRYNGTYIGQATVTSLPAGSTTTATISWNTTSVPPGIYELEASVPGLQAEKDQGDNSNSLLVKIRKTGDADGDGDVDLDDLIATYLAQFSTDPRFDMDGDSDVDLDDLILVFINQFT